MTNLSTATTFASTSFVPSAAQMRAVAIVPVRGFLQGAVPVASEVLPSGDFVVWFDGQQKPLVCKPMAFDGPVPQALIDVVGAAGAAGTKVFPVVAQFGKQPASGFFCGISLDPVAAPGTVAPSRGSFA